MYCDDFSYPTVAHCSFIRNVAASYTYGRGGAISNEERGTLKLHNCEFIDNYTDGQGGAVCNYIADAIMTKCVFRNNEAVRMGGAVYNWGTELILDRCEFYGNYSAWRSGGVFGFNAYMEVTSCLFRNNAALWDGGGLSCRHGTVDVYNSAFFGNSVEEGPGGGICAERIKLMVRGCSFSKNSALDPLKGRGGAIYISTDSYSHHKIVNSILWDNSAVEGKEIWVGTESTYYHTTLDISYTDLEGGQDSIFLDPNSILEWGPSMISADPQFADPTRGDYHLLYGSPCRGSGDNRFAQFEESDFEGDPRIVAGTVDMGADEFHTHLYCLGDAVPGGTLKAKFVGLPGTTNVSLYFGSKALDPPITTPFGDWFLGLPIVGPVTFPPIPSTGVLEVPAMVPAYWPAPMDVLMQALVGNTLSNLYTLEIRE